MITLLYTAGALIALIGITALAIATFLYYY